MINYYGSGSVSKDLFYEQLVDSPPPVISIDVETISLAEQIPIGFAIATSLQDAWYFRTLPEPDPEIEVVKNLLARPDIKKVFHNAPFDLRVFPLIFDGIDRDNIADTNVMARLCGHTETKLQVLAAELFSKFIVTAPDLLLRNSAKTMSGVPYEEVSEMCASHAKATLELYYHFIDDIDAKYFDVEMRVIPVLIDMSLRGMRVNQEDRAKVEIKLKGEVEFYKKLCAEEDFNPGSTQQVGYILAKRGNFLPFTRSKKQLKTDKETLGFIDDPLAAAVLSYRNAQKLLSTYIAPLAGQERIYTNYNLDAVVGRVSSSKMNMQNIPPRDMDRPLLPEGCRFIFEPDSGMFTTIDFSQEHLYILMYMAGDKQMERVFYEGEAKGDIHQFTANSMRIPRRLAKTINYAMLYGATDKTISAHAKIRDLKRCAALRDSWFETFRDSAYWIKEAQEEGMRTGWAFPTLFGRRIRVPEEVNQWGRVDTEGMKRKAVNYPIIGTDGEIMKRALLVCEREKLPIAVTVHDSISEDGEDEFPIEELENIAPVRIPIKVTKSERWE